jgi:hypothetical protein
MDSLSQEARAAIRDAFAGGILLLGISAFATVLSLWKVFTVSLDPTVAGTTLANYNWLGFVGILAMVLVLGGLTLIIAKLSKHLGHLFGVKDNPELELPTKKKFLTFLWFGVTLVMPFIVIAWFVKGLTSRMAQPIDIGNLMSIKAGIVSGNVFALALIIGVMAFMGLLYIRFGRNYAKFAENNTVEEISPV